MTKDQEAHVAELLKQFKNIMTKKYEAGAKEHGGNIWEKSPRYLLDQAIMENIDQFVYLMTLKQKTDFDEI